MSSIWNCFLILIRRYLISKSAFTQFLANFTCLHIWKNESQGYSKMQWPWQFLQNKGSYCALKSGTKAKNAVVIWTTSSFINNKRSVIWIIPLHITWAFLSAEAFRSDYRMHALTINDRACSYFACKKQRILTLCLQRYFWRTSLLRWIFMRIFYIDIGTICCNVFAKYRGVTGICIIRLATIWK